MTQLAVNCARLRIAVDPARLYDSADPLFVRWVGTLADKVSEANRADERKAKAKGKRG